MVPCDHFRPTAAFLVMFLCLAGSSALLPAAQSPVIPDFPGLMREAQALRDEHKFDDAFGKFDSLRVLAQERHEDLWEARAISGLASVLYRQARYPLAREKHLASLAVFQRLGAREDEARADLGLGNVAWYMGDMAEAKTRYKAAIAIYDALGAIGDRDSAILNLLKIDAPPPSEVQETYRQLESDAVRLGDARLEASVMHSWGDLLYTSSDYREAVGKLERAESLYRQIDARDALATVYNSLGRIYRSHGRYELALDFQLKALKIHEALHAGANTIQSLNAVAVTYESLGKWDMARSYYERAIALAERTGAPRLLDFLHANLAELLIDKGEFATGAKMLEQVLARAADTHTSTRFGQLSFAYLHLGRDRDGLDAAQKAFALCHSESAAACLYAQVRRAEAYLAAGNKPAAEADLRSAMTTIEDLHAKLIPKDFLKQRLHQNWEPLYTLAIELSYREGNARAALEIAELARSRAFLDLLAERQIDVQMGNGNGMQRQPLSGSLAPAGQASKEMHAGTSAVSQAAKPAEASRPSILPSVDPVPASLGPASPLAAPASAVRDISAIAARLQSTLISYWVAADAVYIWVVDPAGVVGFERVGLLRSKLQDLVQATSSSASGSATGSAQAPAALRFRGSRAGSAANPDMNPWVGLYDVLIKPVRKFLPQAAGARLTIVPHGPLLNLSFAALRDPQGHYLVEHYALHYVPASAVLQFAHASHPLNPRHGAVLLVADPASPSGAHGEAPLARLPGARAEVTAVARLFSGNQVTLLADKDATEARVREASAGKAVIHFATHAVVLDGNPLDSYLALAGPGDSSLDGLLTAQKIYGLRLNADMVVLSACRSAGGLVTGDGIAALARAFFYAGTSSIVASLWNVPDQPTDQLLTDFFQFWLRGLDKDRALREAQLKLLHDLRNGKLTLKTPVGEISLADDPAFWAGFVLLGEPD